MICPDSSVLVAAFSQAHPFFALADRALEDGLPAIHLVGHAIAETYAVLSAPNGPYPATLEAALAYIAPYLDREPVGVSPAAYPAAIAELADAGVRGGSVYDGLIALAVRDADAELISLDTRAARTYAKTGVRYRLLLPV